MIGNETFDNMIKIVRTDTGPTANVFGLICICNRLFYRCMNFYNMDYENSVKLKIKIWNWS